MYLLKALWDGNVNPSERFARKDSEYMKIKEDAHECMECLLKELTPEGKNILEDFYDKTMQAMEISEEDTFIRGVRIGAHFILDVVGDYRSQLPLADDN